MYFHKTIGVVPVIRQSFIESLGLHSIMTLSVNRKSILYHLQILDETSEVSVDLSEYPC